jgi:hypothetical protein
VNDYRVASFPLKSGVRPTAHPEGTRHAYLQGGKNTACGFGLGQMHQFERLRFSDQPARLSCHMCLRFVVAADR